MKRTVFIALLLLVCIIIIMSFSLFSFIKIDNYPYGKQTKIVRKVENKGGYLNFLKPSANNCLTNEDIIIYKNPTNFDPDFPKKENYFSRLIGKPGDTVLIYDTKVYVNNRVLEEDYLLYYLYRLTMSESVNFKELLENTGVELIEVISDGKACNFIANKLKADEISKFNGVVNIRKIYNFKGEYVYGIFPSDVKISWNPDNFGPLVVPKKGVTVSLNANNISIYKYIIDIYEDNDLYFDPHGILINGEHTNQYTFKKDYFFVLNDNRYEYKDSRKWGFIPEDQIVGKVLN